jgi:hypothetical protein
MSGARACHAVRRGKHDDVAKALLNENAWGPPFIFILEARGFIGHF